MRFIKHLVKYIFILGIIIQVCLFLIRTLIDTNQDVFNYLSGYNNWILDLFLYIPNFIYLLPCILFIFFGLWLKQKFIVLLYIICLLLMYAYNLDYNFKDNTNKKDKNSYKIMTFNINHGNNLKDKKDLKLFLDDINPDIIAYEAFPKENIKNDIIDYQNFLPDNEKKSDKSFNKCFISKPDNNIVLFSRLSIIESKSIKLQDDNYALFAKLEVKEGFPPLYIIVVNLNQVFPKSFEDDRKKQYDELINMLGITEKIKRSSDKSSIILLGSFNFPPDTKFARSLREGAKDNNGIMQEGYHYKDSFLEAGSGFEYTYHSYLPVTRIDQIYGNDSIEFTNHYTKWKWFSNHFPVIAEFKLK